MNDVSVAQHSKQYGFMRDHPHSFPSFLDPGSKLLICLYYNLMNAQSTSVSSSPCVCTKRSTLLRDLFNPTPPPPPNLVIFNGTATSVITGKSCASHTFFPAALEGEYLQVIRTSWEYWPPELRPACTGGLGRRENTALYWKCQTKV